MRIRTIKPAFWSDEVVGRLSYAARLLFISTWSLADDEGRLRWHPAHVRAAAFVYDDLTLAEVSQIMSELTTAGLLVSYRVRDQQFAHVPTWKAHQKINRPSKSQLPPPFNEPSRSIHGALTEDSLNAHGALREGSLNPHGTLTEPSVNLDGPKKGPAKKTQRTPPFNEPSVSPHGALTEPSVSPHCRKGREGKGREERSSRARAREAGPTTEPNRDPAAATAATEKVYKLWAAALLPIPAQPMSAVEPFIAAACGVCDRMGLDPVVELGHVIDYCARSPWRTWSNGTDGLTVPRAIFGGIGKSKAADTVPLLRQQAAGWRRQQAGKTEAHEDAWRTRNAEALKRIKDRSQPSKE